MCPGLAILPSLYSSRSPFHCHAVALVGRALDRRQCPGVEIVPSNEPITTPVAGLNSRRAVKLPLAPAIRPVPPVMTAFSTMCTIGPCCAAPVKLAVSVSPFAAVNVYVPCPVAVAKFTVCGNVTVNCPSNVAVPVAWPFTVANGG